MVWELQITFFPNRGFYTEIVAMHYEIMFTVKHTWRAALQDIKNNAYKGSHGFETEPFWSLNFKTTPTAPILNISKG